MKIYLLNNNTQELITTYENVKDWGNNYVVFMNNGNLGKIYCDEETEYFSDTLANN